VTPARALARSTGSNKPKSGKAEYLPQAICSSLWI
jgi:hypothetical protein